MKRISTTSFFLLLFFSYIFSFAQEYTNLEITTFDNPAPGYIFTGPLNKGSAVLYDNNGKPAYWKYINDIDLNVMSLRILENGYFAFIGTMSNKWYVLNTNLDIIDSVEAPNSKVTNFHTLHTAPNGNYLILTNDSITIDMSKKIPNGSNNVLLINLVVQELDKNTKRTVFSWNAAEHVDVMDATEDVVLSLSVIDPYHINQAIYDSDGNILINFRDLDEIYKINRTTGATMWIMGGCKSRRNQFTFINDTYNGFTGFSHQHDPKRLPNGNILLFDNGNLKPTPFSRAVEYRVDETNKTVTKVWEYRHSPDLFAEFMGNAQRLPNGNTMIGWGANYTTPYDIVGTEVTTNGKVTFEMSAKNAGIYQTLRNVYKMDAAIQNITSNGTYSFLDAKNQTGVQLLISSLNGSGYTSVEKHYYEAINQTFFDAVPCYSFPNRWVIHNQGINSFTGKIYFDVKNSPEYYQKQHIKIYYRANEGTGQFKMLNTTYNYTYGRVEANISDFGEFILGYTQSFPPQLKEPLNNELNVSLNDVLVWTPNNPADKYEIEISKNDIFNVIYRAGLDIIKSEFEVFDLENLTTYYWRVRSINKSCQSDWSPTRIFTTVISSPLQILPLDKSKDIATNGMLKWELVNGGQVYKLQIAEDSIFTKLVVSDTFDFTNQYRYKNLKNNKTYYWRTVAGNRGLYGYWSPVWSFRTALIQPMLQSPALSSKGISLNGKLTWNKSDAAKTYRIQLSSDSLFDNLIIDQQNLTLNEIAYSNLDNKTNYYWRIKATDGISSSEWTDVWNFRTIVPAPVLKLPINKAQKVSITGSLTWTNVADAKTYQIQISDNIDFSNLIFDKESFINSIKCSQLGFEQKYYWRVRCIEAGNKGDWSNIFEFSTQPENVLSSPNIIYPKNEEFKVSINPQILWNESFGAGTYQVELAENINFDSPIKFNDITSTDLVLPSQLNNDKTYFIRLKAKNSKSESDWSETIQFTTKLVTPIHQKDSHHQFNWSPVADAISYNVQISKSADFSQDVTTISNVTNQYADYSGFEPKQVYYWRVLAQNNDNESDWSNAEELKPDQILFVNEQGFNELQLGVFPDPATVNSRIEFTLPNSDRVSLMLIDELGNRTIIEDNTEMPEGTHVHNLPVGISSGTYFITLETKGYKSIRKVIITK